MDEEKTRVCPECGTILEGEPDVCPECGCEFAEHTVEPAEPRGLRGWVKRNKKYLIAAGVGLVVGAATVGVIKEREKIAAYAGDLGKAAKKGYRKAVKEVPKLAGKVADSKAAGEVKESLGNLAVKATTVIAAGKKVADSAKDIKEFLDNSGIAERLPDAKDLLPVVGQLLGDAAKKATKTGGAVIKAVLDAMMKDPLTR